MRDYDLLLGTSHVHDDPVAATTDALNPALVFCVHASIGAAFFYAFSHTKPGLYPKKN